MIILGSIISFQILHTIPEHAVIDLDIDIENSPICLVCLDSDGPFIESGCKYCKNSNNMIHKKCLDHLNKRDFHMTKCYICKQSLPPKTDPYINMVCNYFCYLLFYLLLGFSLKLLFFAGLLLFHKTGVSVIDKLFNPFENTFNAVIQCLFTLMGFAIGRTYLYIYQLTAS